jgi:L-amino acid N-acyltransferase YncA
MSAPAPPEKLRAAPPRMTVRPATPADADAIAAIHVAGYEDAYRGLLPDAVLDVRTLELRRRVWGERLAREHGAEFTDVAEIDGVVGAFHSGRGASAEECGAESSATGCWESLYTDPVHLGGSAGMLLGFALHRQMLERMAALGFTDAVAFVVEGNDRARRFFLATGWALDGTTREVEGALQHRLRRAIPIPQKES